MFIILVIVVAIIYCLPCANYCAMSLQKTFQSYNILEHYFFFKMLTLRCMKVRKLSNVRQAAKDKGLRPCMASVLEQYIMFQGKWRSIIKF